MAAIEPHVNRYGLTELERPNPANVDIVFVHGLNGDPHDTWTSQKSKNFWPKHLLPPLLQDEKARILVYGYDADVTSFTGDGVSRDKIHNHAENLVAGLVANRRMRKMTERPIVFIAHSLGGLVVKRALIYSAGVKGNRTEHLRDVFVSTHGVLFLGTPHHGADIAKWGTRLEWIASVVIPKKIIDSSPDLVNALKKDNEVLIAIDRDFMQIINLFHVYFFHEGKPTDVKGTMTFIVDETSASPTIQDVERGVIQASHSQMSKFDDDNSPGFELVYEAIQRYASEAPASVAKRWTLEKDIRGRELMAQIPERFLHPESSRSSSPSKSTAAVPAIPHHLALLPAESQSNFGSMDYEVEELPERECEAMTLFHWFSYGNSATNTPLKNSQALPQTGPQGDESINPEQPPKPAEPYWIVPPGFRENIFWVDRSKEMRELHQRLHDRKRRNDGTACVLLHGQAGVGKSHLARQYVNKHREKFFTGGIFWVPSKIKEEREKVFWEIHQKVVARDSPELCTNPDKPFRESVKAWFEARHDWLIVFDGVVVDKDADVTELAGFVPDSKNSSIIYISLSKSLESKRRLRQPFPIRVAPLTEEHARNLLLKQLEHERKRKPTEAEKKAATELVKKMGCLPLAIDAISHRIAETSEPLTKFNIKSYSADPKLKGTYETILKDLQLSHPQLEAWNLINILCFFGQHIPVEMVHLGLRGLPSEVKIKSSEVDGEEPNLNTTFSTLMKYALIERNPPEDKSSATSSYDDLVDPIDMLKLHSVVQKFCCDSLDASKLLPEWLTHAAELFAYSYQKADEKIKQKPEPGRISDYRDYLVHGQHLLDHTRSYEKKSQNLEVVRMQLSPVLDLITQEIRSRELSSSQESVNRGIFQISIFDRTNSSSDSTTSLPDQLRDYSNRPTILPPHYNQFGMDGQQQLYSPRSVSTASPVERRGYNHNGIIQMPEAPDLGYESEMETRREALPMQNSLSDHTVRPPPRPPSPEWAIVNRKPRKAPRKDLGEVRKLQPGAAPAQVKSNMTNAIGSVGWIQKSREALRPRDSDVSALLRDIKQHSPPPKKSVLNFWQQKTPPKRPSQPIIHHHQHPQHESNFHVSGSPMPVYYDPMERLGSRESFRTGQSSQHGSPRPSPRISDLRSDSDSSIPENRYRDSSTSSMMEDVPNYTTRPSLEGSSMNIDNRHLYSNNNGNNQSNIPDSSNLPYDPTRPRHTTNENFEPIYPSYSQH
ncbi:hypothetical protein MMC31_006882, partial [Peltigera leucophlebia]|nr:hypothetical protein [Peltigera leucophlebia]